MVGQVDNTGTMRDGILKLNVILIVFFVCLFHQATEKIKELKEEEMRLIKIKEILKDRAELLITRIKALKGKKTFLCVTRLVIN